MAMHRRVLVHFNRRSHDRCCERIAQFTDSVVDAFDGKTDEALVDIQLYDNKLIISNPQTDRRAIRIRRPAFCPIHNLSPALASQLPNDTRERGIDVGCALLLESADGRVLLTRRAAHLRTFPGIWVPPGGHVEENESLTEASFRELKEETGLTLSLEHCVKQTMSILALWESAYPPLLSSGLPIRHHVIAYMHAKLCPPYTADALKSQLDLLPAEVSAATWLNNDMASTVAALSDESATDGDSSAASSNCFPSTMDIVVVDADGRHTEQTVSSGSLLNRVPLCGPDVERVSTGTKFALSEWLKVAASRS